MTAPEDQNSLREALARVLYDHECVNLGPLWTWDQANEKERAEYLGRADAIIAGPLASLITERDAAIEKVNELEAWCDRVAVLIKHQQGWQTYGQWLEADADAAMAHEIADQRAKVKAFRVEITRLKEGMEAAPSEAQIAMGAAACIDVWCGGKSWRTAEGDGPSQEFMAGADWEMAVTLTKAVLATLSPKEQP